MRAAELSEPQPIVEHRPLGEWSWGRAAAAIFAVAWLWFRLIDHLQVEWTVNPQYRYGWAVPVLTLFLLWRTRGSGLERQTFRQESCKSKVGLILMVCLALAYLFTRLIEEANPDWRLVSWLLALEVCGITFLTLRRGFLRPVVSRWTFPLLFFLVAVPWPTIIEAPLVQALMRANAGTAVELLNLCGIPSLRHGNLLEVGTGVVGIDEACSGIRSFQAAFMLSLFFGEYYRLRLCRRAWCVIAGFAFSFLFNVVRTTLLTWVAARNGVSTLERWHDFAGGAIVFGCFAALWVLARGMRVQENGASGEPHEQQLSADFDSRAGKASGISEKCKCALEQFEPGWIGLLLLGWILVVEVGTQSWYKAHETTLPKAIAWSVDWPRDKAGFRELPLSERTKQFLRYSQGLNATWEQEGHWQAIFLLWNPGRTAARLARSHGPETCLTATGNELLSVSEPQTLTVKRLQLPVRFYTFKGESGALYVLYCLWQDRPIAQGFETERLTWRSRLAAVTAGLRNTGQRSLELAVWGGGLEEAEARTVLEKEFRELVCPERQ